MLATTEMVAALKAGIPTEIMKKCMTDPVRRPACTNIVAFQVAPHTHLTCLPCKDVTLLGWHERAGKHSASRAGEGPPLCQRG